MIIRSGLEALYFTGAHWLLSGLYGGVGAVLMLHRVRPARDIPFQPNRFLEVTPEFLEAAVIAFRREGLEAISLDEMSARLRTGDFKRRFICLTFDDGYRDNREWAYPILKRHDVPFAVYVPTDMPDGRATLWWLTLEAAIATRERIDVALDDGIRHFACRTTEEKYAAVRDIHAILRAATSEQRLRAIVTDIATRAGVDQVGPAGPCMSWPELRELASDPLVTIGAHTVSHPILSKTEPDLARREMSVSAARIATELGSAPAHMSYPFGDPAAAGPREFALARELGFKTAVTTRPGVLFPEHARHLWALPRISLNGEMQRLRYLKVLTSGAGTAVWNRFRRVNVA